MVDLSNNFPQWGKDGTFPSSGFFYEGGDQVNSKHLNALWDELNKLFGDIVSAFESDYFDVANSGVVDSGDAKLLYSTSVENGNELYVTQAALVTGDGQAAPTDLDLIIATLDNAGGGTEQATVVDSDGSTVFDDETGDPLANHQNSSGSAQTVGLLVDNGEFGAGSGSDQDHYVSAMGRVEPQ